MNGDYLVLLVSLCIILPLSLLRNLGKEWDKKINLALNKEAAHGSYYFSPSSGYLGYTSGLSLLCMVFFLIVVSLAPPCFLHSWRANNNFYFPHILVATLQWFPVSIQNKSTTSFEYLLDTGFNSVSSPFSLGDHKEVPAPVPSAVHRPREWNHADAERYLHQHQLHRGRGGYLHTKIRGYQLPGNAILQSKYPQN